MSRRPIVVVIVICAVALAALLVHGCGGGGGRVHPAPSAEELILELSSRTDQADLQTSYSNLLWVVGAGDSTLPSPLNGMPSGDRYAGLLSLIQSQVNSGDTEPLVTLDMARQHMAWVTEDTPTFVNRLNVWISAHWSDTSLATHNIVRLMTCSSVPFPNQAPTLTGDTRLAPAQMHLIMLWSLLGQDSSRQPCDLEKALADRAQRIYEFYSSWPWRWLISSQDLENLHQAAIDAQKTYEDCMHHQN